MTNKELLTNRMFIWVKKYKCFDIVQNEDLIGVICNVGTINRVELQFAGTARNGAMKAMSLDRIEEFEIIN